MPNHSQLKREHMLAFLQKIKDEHRDDDDMLIALGEIESELTSKKYDVTTASHNPNYLNQTQRDDGDCDHEVQYMLNYLQSEGHHSTQRSHPQGYN